LELDINEAVRETHQADDHDIETHRDDDDCFVEFKKAIIFGELRRMFQEEKIEYMQVLTP
jgi:hypothetical protein